jgi:type VI secretion system protein ImpB
MAAESGQKFIKKNRAPRVQIEYDVELAGAEKKVNLPMVTGVVADLSGKPENPLPKVDERQFMEINADNFDERLKSQKPRVAFTVPNTLSGEGNIAVDMTFESMEDFSPASVTQKVAGLRELMEARQQLSNLLSYMDGKQGAEELLGKILQDPVLLQALASKALEPTQPPTQLDNSTDQGVNNA